MARLIRVSMTDMKVVDEPLPDDLRLLGGRALTSELVAREVPPTCDALGPRNRIVIAPGILSGTVAANSGRLSIGAKSPLTSGIKESNVGGNVSARLAKLGVAAVIIEGAAPAGAYTLWVSRDGAELHPADDLKGLGTYEVVARLRASSSGELSCLAIGPAGEMLMCSAGIAATSTNGYPSRCAGRGGLGAVMGSKGLKAIVFGEARGARTEAVDEAAFRSASKSWGQLVKNHVISDALREFGTPNTAGAIDAVGAYPTRNFSSGTFEGIEKLNGQTVHDIIKERGGKVTHAGCSNCVIQCSNEFVDEKGDYVTSAFEYETIWANGANCGIDDIDALARMDWMLDDCGLDSMETGCAIAVAMEAGVKAFGDAAGAMELLQEVRAGTPLGRIIGNGAAMVGKAFGVRRVPVVKNQAMAGYDPRGILGQGVGYATSPMGADHTACFAPAQSVFGVSDYIDPLQPEGQIEYARALQVDAAMLDALGFCQFVAFPLADKRQEGMSLIAAMVNSKLGTTLTPADLIDMGRQVLSREREFNRAAGLTAAEDRLPEFFLTEQLPPHQVVFSIPEGDLDTVLDFESSPAE
jgi:aldehyde:ferredoxin oxidoreductase